MVRAGASVLRNAEPLGPFFNSTNFGATFFGGTAANPVLIGPNNSGTVNNYHSQDSVSFSSTNQQSQPAELEHDGSVDIRGYCAYHHQRRQRIRESSAV